MLRSLSVTGSGSYSVMLFTPARATFFACQRRLTNFDTQATQAHDEYIALQHLLHGLMAKHIQLATVQ